MLLAKEKMVDTGKVVHLQHRENECTGKIIDEEVITDQENLNDLYTAVCGCTRCPLGATRNKFVFGAGNPHADVMFIGEAPGADEDAQGIPFVGRAGQLLTKMIEAIKLSREEVFIGNILKCRPPGNRDPKPVEIECCEPILVRQIELIRPTIICALGRIAGQTLLRSKSSLGALRGKIHDYHGVKLMVTYHPAALLRNPNWKPQAWGDLKFLRREYDGMVIG
ncbi:MAG: uracil-DNA glycosylase [Candidatus Latescibacteria bacterium]|nr:uracil-DNA glycosylase [Candidatus Latescibacterota bacterium]